MQSVVSLAVTDTTGTSFTSRLKLRLSGQPYWLIDSNRNFRVLGGDKLTEVPLLSGWPAAFQIYLSAPLAVTNIGYPRQMAGFGGVI